MRAPERTTPAAGGPRAPRSVTEGNRQGHFTATAPILQAELREFVPMQRARAATEREIAEAVGAYNNAVHEWNRQEADTSRPLPRYLVSGRFTFSLGFTRRTRGIVATRIDGAGIFLRTRRWTPFAAGWSCCRRVLARVDVAHAEIRVPRIAMEGRGHE